eukprot:Gb_10946 [translate_table: standard]
MLVLIGGRDFMSLRQKEYYEILEKLGKQVQMVEFEEEEHGFVGLKPENDNSLKLLKAASDFIKTGGGKLSSVPETGGVSYAPFNSQLNVSCWAHRPTTSAPSSCPILNYLGSLKVHQGPGQGLGFRAEERCLLETKFYGGQFLSLKLANMFWELALSIGTNKDHHFCNPLGEVFPPQFANAPLPLMLVLIGDHDFMSSRQKEYCDILEKLGKQDQMVEFEEEEHGFVGLKLENDNSLKILKVASDFIKTGGGKLSLVPEIGV